MKIRAFTLIELLIVIAIIGILSSIVVVSLGDQTDNAKDAKAKFQAGQIKTEAVLHFNEYSSYLGEDGTDGGSGNDTDFCSTDSVQKLLDLNGDGDAADTTGSVIVDAVCNDASDAYAVFFPLENPKDSDNEYWCVDNTGESKEKDLNSKPNTTDTDC